MRRGRALHFYTPASTANPTGWRPWNSRLSFYSPGAYSLPTTGTAMPAQRFANGGLGSVQFPNYAGLNRARTWRTRDNASSPTPWIYATERHGMSGMGIAPTSGAIIAWPPNLVRFPGSTYNPIPSGATNPITGCNPLGPYQCLALPPIISSQPQTGTNTPAPTYRRAYPWHGAYSYGQQPASSSSAAATAVAPSPSTIIGYDANGTPVYQGQTVSSAGLPIASTTPPAAAGTSWFSQDSLGLGLSNGVYAAIGVGLVLIFKKK